MSTAAIADPPLLHPLHAILLAFPIAGFTGGLIFDITYLRSGHIQWSNFSAWLIASAELFGAMVFVWAVVAYLRRRHTAGEGRALLYVLLIGAMLVTGLINSFQHGRDAWSSVGMIGLLLSTLSTLLALAAGWVAHMPNGRRA